MGPKDETNIFFFYYRPINNTGRKLSTEVKRKRSIPYTYRESFENMSPRENRKIQKGRRSVNSIRTASPTSDIIPLYLFTSLPQRTDEIVISKHSSLRLPLIFVTSNNFSFVYLSIISNKFYVGFWCLPTAMRQVCHRGEVGCSSSMAGSSH